MIPPLCRVLTFHYYRYYRCYLLDERVVIDPASLPLFEIHVRWPLVEPDAEACASKNKVCHRQTYVTKPDAEDCAD